MTTDHQPISLIGESMTKIKSRATDTALATARARIGGA
jgi:hypothetical protein